MQLSHKSQLLSTKSGIQAMFVRHLNQIFNLRNVTRIEYSGKKVTFWFNHPGGTLIFGSGGMDTDRYHLCFDTEQAAGKAFKRVSQLTCSDSVLDSVSPNNTKTEESREPAASSTANQMR